MRRMIIIFVDSSEHVGEGLSGGISKNEKERLDKASLLLAPHLRSQGSVLLLSQWMNPVSRGAALHLITTLNLKDNPGVAASFVGIEGMMEEIRTHDPDTTICCVSTDWMESGRATFFDLFPVVWNKSCSFFSMPLITAPDGVRDGNGRIIVIDYESSAILWLEVLPLKPAEVPAS